MHLILYVYFCCVACSVTSDPNHNIQALSVAQVEAAMKNIRVIKNYLAIINAPQNLTSLSMFRNLEEIHGMKLVKKLI
jgi:stage V sporulation protein SpoVS